MAGEIQIHIKQKLLPLKVGMYLKVCRSADQMYQDDQVNQETVDAVVEELKSATSKLIKVDEKQDNTSKYSGNRTTRLYASIHLYAVIKWCGNCLYSKKGIH